MADEGQTLLDEFVQLREQEPLLRARDAAEALGVSEGALAQARAQSSEVRRLAPSGAGCLQIIEALQSAGRVMTLTRNPVCVHETYGEIGQVEAFGQMGQVVGSIDLRLMFQHWRAGYAMTELLRSGMRSSLQFFDHAGDAVLKIYATEKTDRRAWDALVDRHAVEAGHAPGFAAPSTPVEEKPDHSIDLGALRAGWLELDHTHDFHRLLKDVGAARLQALRLIGEPYAVKLPREAVVEALEGAAESAVPIMAFVASKGCVQIFSGPIFEVAEMGAWVNVMDPDFHMHLRLDQVSSVWRVSRPTKLRGDITSLELFDSDGGLVLQLFGARSPGERENPEWRALLGGISTLL